MRIHILSDLHNEFDVYTPSVSAQKSDVVILAGDIDIKARGVAFARQAFDCPVIYVPGNHEFYSGHLDTTLEKMRAAACDRVRVLDSNEWVISGVRFIGATGWTDYSSSGDTRLAKSAALTELNDFKKIRAAGYRKLQTSDLVCRNNSSLRWLRERIAEPFDGPTVVVTHYAPSMRSVNDDGGVVSHLDASYANNWDDLMCDSVSVWVHGHTHQAVDYSINGARIVSNPRGYPGEETGFDCNLLIDV